MKHRIIFILIFACNVHAHWYNETTQYNLNTDPIDVVIPCHEKDQDVLQICVENAKKFIKNVRRIIVVSDRPLTEKAEWFDESLLPFSKDMIAKEFASIDETFYRTPNKQKRVGWYFKQILNFYAAFVIPDISSNILILDGDTVFLKPVEFIDDEGNMLHVPGSENHLPYFEHMQRLLPGLKRFIPAYSGISHHMLFQRAVLEDLFHLVESHHSLPFWKAYCRCINPKEIAGSGSADYEIYFNFIIMRTNQYKIRLLKWANINRLSSIDSYQKWGYDFVSCHHYAREDLIKSN